MSTSEIASMETQTQAGLHASAHAYQPGYAIVLKTKPVWWFDQKKPEPKPSPVF
jgi:hypothetical protein